MRLLRDAIAQSDQLVHFLPMFCCWKVYL